MGAWCNQQHQYPVSNSRRVHVLLCLLPLKYFFFIAENMDEFHSDFRNISSGGIGAKELVHCSSSTLPCEAVYALIGVGGFLLIIICCTCLVCVCCCVRKRRRRRLNSRINSILRADSTDDLDDYYVNYGKIHLASIVKTTLCIEYR